MASQPFTFFQTGNLTPDPPRSINTSISGTSWTNSWVNATSGRAPAGLKVTIYATATPGTLIQTINSAGGASTSIPTITYSSPTYAYGTQYGISVQSSNIQEKLSPAISAVATWLAQPTFTSVTMSGLIFIIVPATTTGATSYLYSITDTGSHTNTSGATSGTFTNCIPGNQYYSNIYAIATNSQSILSANSDSVWCLATPVITLGTGTNNIYSSGTRIVGTTFTIVWTAVTNSTSYTINLNGTGTQNTTASTTTTYTVTLNASYYAIIKATATNSTSQIVSTATIFCLTRPTITIGETSTYISGTTFYIGWTAGDPNASGYTLYINGGYNSTLPSSPLSTSLGVSVGSSYNATLYATATYSTSDVSIASPTIYCLATPSLTVGSGTNNIYNAGTFIFGTIFTATWSTITNATGYTVVFYNFNTGVTTTNTTNSSTFTRTLAVSSPNRYNVRVSATALYSTSSQSTASSTIYCLTSPSITSGTTIGGSLGTTFTVTWSQGDGNASGYTIFLNGTGTPTTTNSLTFTTPFTVAQGSAYYATVYATAIYSTSAVSTTATIPCILLTFTLSMSGTTFTASVLATPSGYTYTYSALTLYNNSIITSSTGSPFTSLIRGRDYSVTSSATATSSSTATGVNIPRSITVPCIGITITLSMSGSTLTPAVTITPSSSSYNADLYTYTLSAYSLIGGSASPNVANFTGLIAGTSYSVSVSASNYGLTEHFEMISLTPNSGLWDYGPTWNGWTFANAGIAIAGSTWQPPGSAAASGNYYAFLQMNTAYISHRLTGIVGATALITFSYSYRNVTAIPTSYSVYWIPDYGSQVTISSGTVGTLTGWVTITTSWTFSSYYTGVIKFENISPGVGDNALLIDNISVTFSSTNSSSGTITSGSVFCLATPVISSITFAGITITINWTAVANVNSSGNAYIFYYNGIGIPAVITPTNTGTAVFAATSTVTTAGGDIGVPGSSYYIQMLAIGPNTVSALSAASSTIFCLATPVISSISISQLVLSVSWSGVSNANNYSIYLNGGGSVINVGNTTSTTIAVVLGGNSYYCLIFATNTGTSSGGVSSSTVYTHGVFTAFFTVPSGSGLSTVSTSITSGGSTASTSNRQQINVNTNYTIVINTTFGTKPSNTLTWAYTTSTTQRSRTLTITGYSEVNGGGTATVLQTDTASVFNRTGTFTTATTPASIRFSIPSYMYISGKDAALRTFTFTSTITD
jgi:hypothetical protein